VGADGTRQDHRVEHELTQLPGAHAPAQHIDRADPQHADNARANQHEYGSRHQRAKTRAADAAGERQFRRPVELQSIHRLVRVGLYGWHRVEHFARQCRSFGDAVLRRARQAAHVPPHQDDRGQHQRQ